MLKLWVLAIVFPIIEVLTKPEILTPRRCSRNGPNKFRVEFPNQDEWQISVEVFCREKVSIQCNGARNGSAIYDLISGIEVGPVHTLSIQYCPLPASPFSILTTSLSISDLRNLTFESYLILTDSLQSNHFEDLTNVTRLRLPNNGFTTLPPDLLKPIPNLVSLELRGNVLNNIPQGFLSYAPELIFLELGSSKLTQIEPGVFDNLPNLKILNLWSNNIKSILNGSFRNLISLESLDLQGNGIVDISSEAFDDLKNVETISLNRNKFKTVPGSLFAKSSRLKSLKLCDNEKGLILPSRLLSNLENLKEVYLMRNGIENVPDDLFEGSTSLTNVSLSDNYLEKVPPSLFSKQRNLKKLDLSKNRIESVPDGVFEELKNLEILKMDSNQISQIPRNMLRNLKMLSILNMEKNQLEDIHFEAFEDLRQIREINLSHNKLSFSSLPFQSPFRKCLNLRKLNLSNNSIESIFEDWTSVLLNLDSLNLSYNNISILTYGELKYLSANVVVDLSHNKISEVRDLGTLGMFDSPDNKRIPKIILNDNEIICDSNAYDLSLYANDLLPSYVKNTVKIEMDKVKCSNLSFHGGRIFKDILPIEIVSWLPDGCPAPCKCLRRSFDKAYVVNCASAGLHELSEDDFGKIHKERSLNHTELILSDNHLKRLPTTLGDGYEKVTHLFLSRNQLQSLNLTAFSRNLSVVYLDHNSLSKLSSDTLYQLGNSSKLTVLTLDNNPWTCNCYAVDLLRFIQSKYKMIPLTNVSCDDGRELRGLAPEDLCETSMVLLIVCLVIAAASVVLAISASLYYRFQPEIFVWLYAHRWCLWLVTEDELDKDKIYDAFVSFSHKDEDFVIRELVPRLEASGLKLCVHYRDWIAGEFIPNQISRSVESSRRTLVVLSPNFLDSVWGRHEFQAAHKRALSEKRARVVMLLYGEIPPKEELDPELRTYISVNTYVKWGDPWFWDKLRYALPHSPLSAEKVKKYDNLELKVPIITPPTLTPACILRPKADETPVIC